jgi:hypothetical protein
VEIRYALSSDSSQQNPKDPNISPIPGHDDESGDNIDVEFLVGIDDVDQPILGSICPISSRTYVVIYGIMREKRRFPHTERILKDALHMGTF